MAATNSGGTRGNGMRGICSIGVRGHGGLRSCSSSMSSCSVNSLLRSCYPVTKFGSSYSVSSLPWVGILPATTIAFNRKKTHQPHETFDVYMIHMTHASSVAILTQVDCNFVRWACRRLLKDLKAMAPKIWPKEMKSMDTAKVALANSFSELDVLCSAVETAMHPSTRGTLLYWITRLEDLLEDRPRCSVLQAKLEQAKLAMELVQPWNVWAPESLHNAAIDERFQCRDPRCAAVPATHSWMPPNMLLSSSEIGQLPSVTLSQKIPDSKMSADDEAVPPLIEQQLDPAVAAVVASADTITEVPPGYMLDQDGVFCFRPHPGSATQLRAPDTDEVSDDSDGNIVPTSLPPLCDSSSENEVGGPVPANEEDSSEDFSVSDLVELISHLGYNASESERLGLQADALYSAGLQGGWRRNDGT